MGISGINTTKIGEIEKKINDYIQAIESAKITEISKELNYVLDGEEKNKIKSTCQSCESYTNELIKLLNDCKEKIAK